MRNYGTAVADRNDQPGLSSSSWPQIKLSVSRVVIQRQRRSGMSVKDRRGVEEAKPLLRDVQRDADDSELLVDGFQQQRDVMLLAGGDGPLAARKVDGKRWRPDRHRFEVPSDGEVEDGIRSRREEAEDPHAISNCDTIIHLLKGNVGTGILAMGDAIKNSGLVVGTVGLVFFSVCCVTSMHMLLECAQKLCVRTGRSTMTYADVAEHACASSRHRTVGRLKKFSRRVIIVFLCITQLGFCCVYFRFVSANLQKVFNYHFKKLDEKVYLAMTLVPMLALCSVRKMKYLSPISMLANLLQMVSLGLIFFYILRDLPYTWDRKPFASWAQLPLYFGTAIYAFEGIGVVLPLENQMREPSAMSGWNGVLNTSMITVACCYMAVGFFGYLKYGEHVDPNITTNLPPDEWLAQIIMVMMAVAIFFSYGLQFYVPLELMLPSLQSKAPERYRLAVEFVLRYSLVLLTFGLAAAVPDLGTFISLVGSVSSSTLALMAPAVLHTITNWDELAGVNGKLVVARNVFLFMVGFVGFLTGTYVSIGKIVSKM